MAGIRIYCLIHENFFKQEMLDKSRKLSKMMKYLMNNLNLKIVEFCEVHLEKFHWTDTT